MEIRTFQKIDKEALFDIFRQYPYMFEPQELIEAESVLLNENSSYIFVAELDDVVVGCIIFQYPPDSKKIIEINYLTVDKNHLKKKIGTELLTYAENYIAKLNLSNGIFLTTGLSSDPLSFAAISFYKKNGYKQVGIIPDYWGKEDSCIILYKPLLY